ncbi:hypothetical protein H4217_009254, partial [Coemansia sp. RSA 1939]
QRQRSQDQRKGRHMDRALSGVHLQCDGCAGCKEHERILSHYGQCSNPHASSHLAVDRGQGLQMSVSAAILALPEPIEEVWAK